MHLHVYVCSIHLHLYDGKIYIVLIMIPRHPISYKHLFIVDSSSPSHSCILQRIFYGGWWIPKERQARSSLHIDIIISNLNGRKYQIWKYFQLDTLVTKNWIRLMLIDWSLTSTRNRSDCFLCYRMGGQEVHTGAEE